MTPASDPIPWQPPPYDGYRNCSLGICTIYCPQWCTMFFTSPPDPSESGTYFSPLVVSVIVILVSALLLVSYFIFFKKSCGRRRLPGSNSRSSDQNRDRIDNLFSRNGSPAGLEESLIESIPVCKYKKGGGVVEGTECSVCLSEFQDDESLRMLRKCNHAFHLPCIDTWLKSHSSCPLCRANVAPSVNSSSSPTQELPLTVLGSPLQTDDEGRGPATTLSTNSLITVRRDEVVVTVLGDVSASPESVSCEGEGCIRVANVPSEQHTGG